MTDNYENVAGDVHTLLKALMVLQQAWTDAQRPATAQEAQEYVLDVLDVVRAHWRGFQHLVTLHSRALDRNEG